MKTNRKALDKIDRNILRKLQQDGRISNVDLAKAINLSPTPCLERVKRLERQGYIKGYKAELDPIKLDQALIVFVQIKLDHTTEDVFDELKSWVGRTPEVTECHMVAGLTIFYKSASRMWLLIVISSAKSSHPFAAFPPPAPTFQWKPSKKVEISTYLKI